MNPRRPHQSSSSLWYGVGAALIAALAGLVFYTQFMDFEEEPKGARIELTPKQLVKKIEPAPLPLKKIKPAPPPVSVMVSSYPPQGFHPLSGWSAQKTISGFIDVFSITSVSDKASEGDLIKNGDVIEISGWAGHTALGMRFYHVFFSVCGKIVGGAPVNGKRPDVAEKVHPNLSISGWWARLYAGQLPRCENPVLKGWGLAPVGTMLWPLGGDMDIPLPAQSEVPDVSIVHAEQPIDPKNVKQPKPVKIVITARKVNLRKCASTECKIVGKVTGGKLQAIIIEKSDKWSLLQFEGVSGWLANRLFAVIG